MTKCPRCGKEPAIVDASFGVLPGVKCQAEDEKTVPGELPQFVNIGKQHRVQEQRDRYDRDLLQPFTGKRGDKPNPDFVKAYPEKSKDYFTPEQLKDL